MIDDTLIRIAYDKSFKIEEKGEPLVLSEGKPSPIRSRKIEEVPHADIVPILSNRREEISHGS
jgi:hypothetical protein